jgi:hypothetical protein
MPNDIRALRQGQADLLNENTEGQQLNAPAVAQFAPAAALTSLVTGIPIEQLMLSPAFQMQGPTGSPGEVTDDKSGKGEGRGFISTVSSPAQLRKLMSELAGDEEQGFGTSRRFKEPDFLEFFDRGGQEGLV